jgi:zinc/manganese transport system ATP-binding protein
LGDSSLGNDVSAPEAAGGIRLQNAAFGYRDRVVLRNLDWTIPRGSLVAIVGANGAGKSTLLKGLVGEISLLVGALDLGGLDRPAIAYLPQSADIDRSFPISVRDFAAMGLWSRIGALRPVGREGAAEIAAALATVGLADAARAPIGRLSGGQFQRLLFARLMLRDAPVILLDEPFAAIDRETTEDLSAVIQRWHGEGRTVVAALHDLDIVRRVFPQTLRLGNGSARFGATEEILSVADLLPPVATGLAVRSGGALAFAGAVA